MIRAESSRVRGTRGTEDGGGSVREPVPATNTGRLNGGVRRHRSGLCSGHGSEYGYRLRSRHGSKLCWGHDSDSSSRRNRGTGAREQVRIVRALVKRRVAKHGATRTRNRSSVNRGGLGARFGFAFEAGLVGENRAGKCASACDSRKCS